MIALAIAAAPGCRDDAPPVPAPGPATTQPRRPPNTSQLEDSVGEVVDVSGRVVAYRRVADRARVLRRGDPVFEDDELSTVGDALIEIELHQNRAHLVLSHASKRRLVDTAAWSAPHGERRAFIDENNQPM